MRCWARARAKPRVHRARPADPHAQRPLTIDADTMHGAIELNSDVTSFHQIKGGARALDLVFEQLHRYGLAAALVPTQRGTT